MKKILALLLSMMIVVTFMPTVAFAGTSYDSVTLEMEFSDGHMGNGGDFWSGKSESVGFVKAYWKGDNIVKKEYISDDSALSVETISGQEGKLTVSEKDKKHLKLSLSSSLSKEAEYWVNYVGKDKDEFSECTVSVMAHSTKQRDFINKVKYNNFKVTASAKGNTITWTPSVTNAKPDYYLIYRSTSKSKGYKQIDCVDGKTKKYLDNDGIKKDKTYYYKVRAKVDFSFGVEYSKYSEVKAVKAKKTFKAITAESLNKKMIESYDKSMVEYAYAFGLPVDIGWISSPKTDEDYENNVLYLLLIGDYGLNIALPKGTSDKKLQSWGQKFVDMVYDFGLDTYDGLAAFYINEGIEYRINYNHGVPVIELYSSVDLDRCCEALDFEKVFKEQKQALNDALKLKDKLHADGAIKDGMSQKEIMEAYYHALDCYTASDDESAEFMEKHTSECKYNYNCNTIYGFHSRRCCTCGGRAAGFGLSMRLEGVPSYGISVPGHEINVCFIDGKEYYIDAGNQIPAMDREGCIKKFVSIDENSDVDAREAYKKLMGQ